MTIEDIVMLALGSPSGCGHCHKLIARGAINERQEKALLRLVCEGPDGFEGGLCAGNYRTITDAGLRRKQSSMRVGDDVHCGCRLHHKIASWTNTMPPSSASWPISITPSDASGIACISADIARGHLVIDPLGRAGR